MAAENAIAQAPASLLGEKEKPPPPAPQLVTGQSTTPAPTEALSEEWVKAFLGYLGSTMYEATGYEEMRFTSFELAMLTAPLTKMLNRTVPRIAARAFPGLVEEDDPTMVILAAVILLIGIRRILAYRRRRREERDKKGAGAGKRTEQRPAESTSTPPAAPALHVVGPPASSTISPDAESPAAAAPAPGLGMSGQETGGFVGDGRALR